MQLNTFKHLYEQFLVECARKGLKVDIIEPHLKHHVASIKNDWGMTVQFSIQVDFDDVEHTNDSTKKNMFEYAIRRPEDEDDWFITEVKDAFHNFINKHAPR